MKQNTKPLPTKCFWGKTLLYQQDKVPENPPGCFPRPQGSDTQVMLVGFFPQAEPVRVKPEKNFYFYAIVSVGDAVRVTFSSLARHVCCMHT